MMENSADDEQESMITKPLLDDHDGFSGKGGFRTMPFVLGNSFFFLFSFEFVEGVGWEGLKPHFEDKKRTTLIKTTYI